MTDFKLPQADSNDRFKKFSGEITMNEFIEAFQTGPIKIEALESITIVRLHKGTVYIAQNWQGDDWALGSMPLIPFLNAFEIVGSTKVPRKVLIMLTKYMTLFSVRGLEQMQTCMGWDGVCP